VLERTNLKSGIHKTGNNRTRQLTINTLQHKVVINQTLDPSQCNETNEVNTLTFRPMQNRTVGHRLSLFCGCVTPVFPYYPQRNWLKFTVTCEEGPTFQGKYWNNRIFMDNGENLPCPSTVSKLTELNGLRQFWSA
jgi:hypothetical protein